MSSNPAGLLFQRSSLKILASLTLHIPFISSPIPIDKSTLGVLLSTWNSTNYNISICQSLTKPSILYALFLPYSHYAYSTSSFLSIWQLFNVSFSHHYFYSWLHFFLRHKMHHFHHCFSASPTPKFRWTELSAVSYFYLSIYCPFLPYTFMVSNSPVSLGPLLFKISLLRTLSHPPQRPDFHYSLQATLPISSVPLLHR